MNEKDFLYWLKTVAKRQEVSLIFSRIESQTVPGFPDLCLTYKAGTHLLELKSSKSDTLYYQKNQIAFFHQASTHGLLIPTLSIIKQSIYLTTIDWSKPLVSSGERKISIRKDDLRMHGWWTKSQFSMKLMLEVLISISKDI